MNTLPPQKHDKEDLPPILGTWSRFYWVVMLLHALFITLFYLLTQWYS